MQEDGQSLMAALSVNMVTVNMLLSVFFLPGVWTDGCNGNAPALTITTPNTMEALNGSCLLIPCSINKVVTGGNPSGFWINSNSNSIFDSKNSVKSFIVNITGNLRQSDCTTVFSHLNVSHSGTYYFRMENYLYTGMNKPDKATACADPLQVTVNGSPWTPRIVIPGNLKEEESVSITCSARTPCPLSPPELTWNLQQDSHNQTERNTDGTITTKLQENITLSDTHDGYSISCSVRYPVDGGKGFKAAETEVTLNVSYAPKDTSASISPSGLVSAGSWVKLSCSSRAKPPVSSFSWFRISSEGPVQVSEEQLYSFNVTERGEFYCVATNDLGNQTSSGILLSVKDSLSNISDVSKSWVGILVGVVVLVLICLLVSVCCFKFRHRPQQETQNQSVEETDVEISNSQAEVNYGDVMFFKSRPEASPVSEQDRGQLKTVYAEVKVSKPTQTAQPENLYSEVKKQKTFV